MAFENNGVTNGGGAANGQDPCLCSGEPFPREVFERGAPIKLSAPPAITSSAPHTGWLSDAPQGGRETLLIETGMDRGEFSREVSRLMGRPVLVMHLDELPHHNPNGVYSSDQLKDRVEALKAITAAEVPSKVWDRWNWKNSAGACEPTHFSLCTPEALTDLAAAAPLGRRMPNSCWKKAGIVFLPETHITSEEIWTSMAGLDDPPNDKNPEGRWNHALEHIPPGDSVRTYLRRHELCHIEQQHPNCNAELSDDRRNLSELDADMGAFSDIRWLAGQRDTPSQTREELLENSQGIMHIRAMQSFLKYGKPYCFTVAFDTQDYDADTVSPEYEAKLTGNYGQNWLAAYELRLRVLAGLDREDTEILKDRLPKDSAGIRRHLIGMAACAPEDQEVYNAIRPYFESPFNWAGIDPAVSLPVLRDIVDAEEIDHKLARRNAALVLQAVDYFKPSLLEGVRTSLAPAHPQIYRETGRNAGVWQPRTDPAGVGVGVGAFVPA